jgi:DNA segregation ATPase FtsK/SpoIIIE, S-DNA-T family
VRAAIAGGCGADEPSVMVIGDADAWMGNWAVAALMREDADVVVRGGIREFRVFGRGATPPPMLDPGSEACWFTPCGGVPVRAAWPLRQND